MSSKKKNERSQHQDRNSNLYTTCDTFGGALEFVIFVEFKNQAFRWKNAVKTSIDRLIIEIIQRTSQWIANLSREIITLSYLWNEGEQQLTSAARLIFPYLHARRTQRTQQIPHHARLVQLLNTVRERDLQRERNTHVKSDHVRVQVVNENDVNKQNGDTFGHHVKLTFKMSRHWNVSRNDEWQRDWKRLFVLPCTTYNFQSCCHYYCF